MSVRQNVIEPLKLLPHGQELQNYLITFASAITGKKKPPVDYIRDLKPHSGVFVDAADIGMMIDHIRAIYQERGYRTPWELENDLIKKLQPDMPEAAIRLADHYAEAELAADPLTGFYQKTQVPLTMALAALYRQSTGNPVSVIEVDFSNMRGTNEHFEKLIATAENSGITSFVRQEAMMLTDKAAFITASAIRHAIDNSVQTKRTYISLRTGGDEVRIVLPDIDINQSNRMVENIHDSIENVTGHLDLHNHPHSKRPLDVLSNGFGACAASFALEAEGQQAYEEAAYLADQNIQKSKVEIGRKRQDKPPFDPLDEPGTPTSEYYKDPSSAQMHLIKVLESIAELHVDPDIEEKSASKTFSLEDIIINLSPDHFMTINQIHDAFSINLKKDIESAGLSLTPEQEKTLQIKANRFPAIDHATGTLMARDLPAIAGVAAQITSILNHRTQSRIPLWTLGASFHNLSGLNEELGHEAANAVLHRQAHEVLEESLFRAGISRDNFYLAHMGGGEFRILIQPLIFDSDGSKRVINETTLRTVAEMVRQKTEILNEEFADLPNPREDLRPWENGITVTVAAKPYAIDPRLNTNESRRGGAIIAFIGDYLAEEIQTRRKTYIQPATVKGPTLDMF